MSQALVTRLGVKPILSIGMIISRSALLLVRPDLGPRLVLQQTSSRGFIILGIGLGFSFVPISIAALAGVPPAEAGLASGLINTSQQIGGALGVAILTTVAVSRANHELADGTSKAVASTARLPARLLRCGRVRRRQPRRTLLILHRRDSSSSPSAPLPCRCRESKVAFEAEAA